MNRFQFGSAGSRSAWRTWIRELGNGFFSSAALERRRFSFSFFFLFLPPPPAPPPDTFHLFLLRRNERTRTAAIREGRGAAGSDWQPVLEIGQWRGGKIVVERGGGCRFWRRALTLSAGGSLSTQRRWCRLSLSETPAGQWGRGNGRPIRCLPPPFPFPAPPPTRFIYSSFSFTSSSAPPRPARSAAGVERGREKWNGEGSGMDEKKVDWLVSLYVIKSYWARLHLLSLEYAARSVLLIDLELVSRKNGLGVFS